MVANAAELLLCEGLFFSIVCHDLLPIGCGVVYFMSRALINIAREVRLFQVRFVCNIS